MPGPPTKPYTFSNTPTNTNVIDADQVNADFDALYSALANGSITGAQLVANTIGTSQIQGGGVYKANLGTDALNAFLKLASAADRKAAFGATTLSFPNSAFSTVKTVAHGLSATPVVVFVSFGSGATGVTHNINSVDGTNFTVAGYSSIAPINGSVSFYWLAIG